MRDSPHAPGGRTTRILFALFGTLALLIALSVMANGVNPYCGKIVGGVKYLRCAGLR